MSHVRDVSGQRFGRLVAMGRASGAEYGRAYWACRCDCGRTVVVHGKSLRSGKTSSCGCRQRDVVALRNHRHGEARTKEYRSWTHIKGRCLNPADAAFRNYGGRGITIAPEWVTDFPAFLAHIGRAPHGSLTVERIDNSRGYVPGNVRWATRHEQTRNSRRNVLVRCDDGHVRVLTDACRRVGAKPSRAAHLIRRGMAPEAAIAAAAGAH